MRALGEIENFAVWSISKYDIIWRLFNKLHCSIRGHEHILWQKRIWSPGKQHLLFFSLSQTAWMSIASPLDLFLLFSSTLQSPRDFTHYQRCGPTPDQLNLNLWRVIPKHGNVFFKGASGASNVLGRFKTAILQLTWKK